MPAMKHVISVPWSDEERALLRQMWANGMGPVQIARMLGRSRYSVTKQTQTLTLQPQRPQPRFAPEPQRPPEPHRRPPQPLPRGAHTLPPLPSELNR